MKYASVCSGIEAPTVAWHRLGWKPVWFSEIEKFPCRVLKHYYPDVPNLGDMTQLNGNKIYEQSTIDLLVGGTPCQSFSIAGLRKGMADPRGNLALTFLSILDRKRPRWVVWENVPGVLSSVSHESPDPCPPAPPVDMELNGQEVDTEDQYHSKELHALNSFLAGLSELGYGWAMGVYDAQYFGVPQRRRRVFVVGYSGDVGIAADQGNVEERLRRLSNISAAVLFEREGMQGYPAPGGKEGEKTAALTANGVGTCGADDNQAQAGHLIMAHGQGCAEVVSDGWPAIKACTLNANFGKKQGLENRHINQGAPLFVPHIFQSKASSSQSMNPATISQTLDKSKSEGLAVITLGHTKSNGLGIAETDVANTLEAMSSANQAVYDSVSATLKSGSGERGWNGDDGAALVDMRSAVRRLTPLECERLQGFPDNYTAIPSSADGPRYKAIGNSMAVPVMEWIGRRIDQVDKIINPIP